MDKATKAIRSIVTAQCANFYNEMSGINNCCVLSDKPCRYFADNETLPRCKYLEESILLYELNNAARTLYYATLDAASEGRTINNRAANSILIAASKKIECERCKTMFKPASNRQVYCDRCGKIVRRDHQRELMQNRRKIKLSVSV